MDVSARELASIVNNSDMLDSPFQFFEDWLPGTAGHDGTISRQNYTIKKTHILPFPRKPNSVHSAIGSRMNGIAFRSFRKRNLFQKNAITVYSKYSYSGRVPKERALNVAILSNTFVSSFGLKYIHIHGNRFG